MVEAIVGRIPKGTPESLHEHDAKMEIVFKWGEKNRSA